MCESNNFCTFPDTMCETGRRWDDRAPDSIAGQCYEPGAASGTDGSDTDTDTDAGGSSTGEDPTTGSPTTADPTTDSTTTTDPTNGTTTGPEPMTSSTSGADGTTTGGPAQTCDEQYGAATDYMLCEELPDSCAFSVTIGMAESCNDVCTSFGGECIEVQLNDVDLCVSTGAGTCDQMDINDLICVCSRGA